MAGAMNEQNDLGVLQRARAYARQAVVEFCNDNHDADAEQINEVAADAALRLLLTELRDERFEVIDGALRQSVISAYVIDSLLKELG